jgi:hypothetical protein
MFVQLCRAVGAVRDASRLRGRRWKGRDLIVPLNPTGLIIKRNNSVNGVHISYPGQPTELRH